MIEAIKNVDFDEWSKLELRVAQIINVEDIENADKLYKLTLDLGNFGKRIVCAGLKQHYGKSGLLNKKVILFVNLTPRKMRGIESQGMILAAVSEDESQVVLLTPESEIELGSKIR
jgi:methionyl-tRNA synthetase